MIFGGAKATGMPRKRAEPATPVEDLDDVSDGETGGSAPKRSKSGGRKGPASAPQEYENGVVREVVVENFMNHSHLRVELDPHVNFIVGKNGSGKSAVVLALQAGLGCKAQASGKNTSTHKNYIKHGADSACIKIHIANGGGDPYRPDDFGETVVVEHRIEKVRSCPWRPHTRCRSRSRRGAHG